MRTIPETWTITKRAVEGDRGVVSSQHPLACEIGAAVLAEGGNAVDAAVAAGLAIGGVEPWMSGIGGGGYMTVYDAREDRSYCVDFGVIAPRGIDPNDYPLVGAAAGDMFGWPSVLEDRNIHGPHSIAVPGQIAGMDAALRRFGTWSWRQCIQPAITVAKEGMPADWFATVMIASAARLLARNAEAARTYLPDGLPPTMDWHGLPPRLKIGNLETTLSHLADAGADDFYRGDLARSIVADARTAGSRLSLDDLASYRVTIGEADSFTYRDATVSAPAGLNAGPSLRLALDRLDKAWSPGPDRDADAYCAFARALVASYEHRLAHLGDADESKGPSCTTHLSVVDRDGNMVALTQTLLSTFGSRVMLPASGILMNNGMMWFDPRPGRPNSISPGGRPLSNMCPVVVRRPGGDHGERDLRLALGASGGRRIFPSIMQIISFLVDYHATVEDALAFPRIDCNGGDVLMVDAALPESVRDALSGIMKIRVVENGLYPPQFATPTLAGCWQEPFRSIAAAHPHSPWACARAEP